MFLFHSCWWLRYCLHLMHW